MREQKPNHRAVVVYVVVLRSLLTRCLGNGAKVCLAKELFGSPPAGLIFETDDRS